MVNKLIHGCILQMFAAAHLGWAVTYRHSYREIPLVRPPRHGEKVAL